jgi:hypothetical protein
MNDKLERILKKAVMSLLEVLYRHLSGRTEEKSSKTSVRCSD